MHNVAFFMRSMVDLEGSTLHQRAILRVAMYLNVLVRIERNDRSIANCQVIVTVDNSLLRESIIDYDVNQLVDTDQPPRANVKGKLYDRPVYSSLTLNIRIPVPEFGGGLYAGGRLKMGGVVRRCGVPSCKSFKLAVAV